VSLAYLPLATPLFLAGVLGLSLAAFAWRRRSRPEARGFILLMMALALWSFAEALLQSSDTESLWTLWTKVGYLGIQVVPLAWWLTAYQYGSRAKTLPKSTWVALAAIPVITVALVWTQELHTLIYQDRQYFREGGALRLDADYGVWFWLQTVYAYILLLWGAALFLAVAVRSFHLYRTQAFALLSAVVLPWVGNALYVFRVGPYPGLDWTPFTFAVAGIPLAWAVFRLRLYDLAPVARNTVIQSMRDGMIVLDLEHRISDLNPAGSRVLGAPVRALLGQPAETLFGDWILESPGEGVVEAAHEITLPGDGGERLFEVDQFPLADTRDEPVGCLLVLRDITERRAVGEELDTAREQIRVLSGLLPICSWCKQVRDDEGYWEEIETFVAARSDAHFTHSVCPSCLEGMEATFAEDGSEGRKRASATDVGLKDPVQE
jgi:PAS domain S-box-containing protein